VVPRWVQEDLFKRLQTALQQLGLNQC
jgi:hypothetical protein